MTNKKEKDETAFEPELVVEKKTRLSGLAARDGDAIVATAFTPPAKVPFGNYFNRKRIEAYRKVIGAERGLADELVGHQKALSRLLNIETEIEADRIEQEIRLTEGNNRLAEAKRKASLRDKEDRLANLDMDLQIADKEKKLKELREDGGPVNKDELADLKTDLEKKLKEFEVYRDYSRRKKILRLLDELKTKEDIEAVFYKMLDDLTGGADYEELDSKTQQKVQDLQDLMDTVLERE